MLDIELFGFTVNATQTSSFLPFVILMAIAAPLSKFLTKHLPKAISGFLSPVITLMITLPLGFAFIGPAATALGNAVNAGINVLLGAAPVLAGIVITGIYQVLVLFCIHSAMTSFSFMSLLSGNPDTVMALIGCTPWGVIDLFSASTGEIAKRYGMIYVNKFDGGTGDLSREKKNSFCWYQKVIASNGENLQ